jgi:signal transduction histidine kinase
MQDKIDLNVLIVEDNKECRNILNDYLNELCSCVYLSTNPLEAISIFKNKTIDVVITDVHMPQMSGLDMAEEILKTNEEIPIIVISGFDDSKYLYKAINMGIYNYLIKPINPDLLYKKLKRIASRKQDKIDLENYKIELETINKNLLDEVQREVQKNKIRDTILFSQAKAAQMGELLNMIAHQWRQPLNAISGSTINLSVRKEIGLLEDNDIFEHVEFVEKQTQHMSQTINDFMNFFKPSKEKNSFCIKELLEKIHTIVDAQLKNKSITLKLIGEEIIFDSYEKELSNVFLNFISNSRDAFESLNIDNKQIIIKVDKKENNEIEIIYQDNAGGIPQDIIEKIFNPYFTTKDQGKGTGIGLYMTKRIVEEVLKGNISVTNIDNGVEFIIKIKTSF